ncbi:MAG: hypothetical protein R3F13_21055 [Prosthecobacter sp.]
MLDTDAAWVPSSMAQNPALVNNVAETGEPPMAFGGAEATTDLTIFCKVVTDVLSKNDWATVPPTMIFSRKTRQEIRKKLMPEPSLVNATNIVSELNLKNADNVKESNSVPIPAIGEAPVSSSSQPKSWWFLPTLIVASIALLWLLSKTLR